ncbi:MAG: GspH/FimT family pseudopilin [Pseudomonadota bacterium]|nr:MAG: GspH/FimT family pseudopilin [Pseudomonadota bacterium]
MKNRISGLTLVELMVMLAVVAILIAVGVPNLRNIISGNRLTTQINQLSNHLAYARSEAVTRSKRVGLMSAGGANWEAGWTVWVDDNGDRVMDAGEERLRVAEAMPANIALTNDTGSATIVYDADGTAVETQAAAVAFTLCNNADKAVPGRELTINVTGRPELTKTDVDCGS